MADEEKLSDSIIEGREREKRFREESARNQAEQAEQENRQRARQERHQALARQEDDATRAKIFARYLQAEEEAKAQARAEVPPVPNYSPRQLEELALEQQAGRRQLERHKRHFETAAAARDRTGAEEKAKEVPGSKV